MQFQQLEWPLREELEDGADGSTAAAPEPELPAWASDLDDVRQSLSAAETRFGERLGPVQQTLQGLQAALAKQTAVEVPDDLLAQFEEMFVKYDPQFAGVGAKMKELLTRSVRQRDLTPEALQPLLQPMLEQESYRHATRWLDQVHEVLTFPVDELESESFNPNAPTTDTQRMFMRWWGRVDEATRRALTGRRQDGSIADPYAYGTALKAFNRFYKDQVKNLSESAGASASRLAGATQTKSAARSTPTGPKLQSEEDGFMSVFKKAS